MTLPPELSIVVGRRYLFHPCRDLTLPRFAIAVEQDPSQDVSGETYVRHPDQPIWERMGYRIHPRPWLCRHYHVSELDTVDWVTIVLEAA